MSATSNRSAVAALATAGLTLVLADPAGATGKTPTPPAKNGCEVQLKGPGAGQSIVYPHDYSFSVVGQDNKTQTYTCNDGTWKETVTLTAGTWTTSVAVPLATYQVL